MKTGIGFREGIVALGALISFEFKMSKKKKKDNFKNIHPKRSRDWRN